MLRYFSTKGVKEKIKAETLTENEVLSYFFLTVLYDSFFHSMAASRTYAIDDDVWYQFTAWSFFICTVMIWVYCFAVNGGPKGSRLLVKVFPLSVTVGYKYALILIVSVGLTNSLMLSKPLWLDPLLVYSINIAMAINIGHHIKDIRRFNA